jgi:hypothetical protein
LIRARSLINPNEIDLESLYVLSRNIKLKVVQGRVSSNIVAILMNMVNGHLPEAETWIQKAVNEDQTNGKRFFLGRDYALLR